MTPRVLFVCRANRCRSPFAAEMLRHATAGREVTIESAGLLPGGYPVPPAGLQLASTLGLDLAAHRSRRYDALSGGEYDVVLTMGRDQARELVSENDLMWPRVFTLVAFAAWIDAHPLPAGGSLGRWIDHAGADRDRRELVGTGRGEDILDPFDAGPAAWRAMYEQLVPPVQAVAAGLSPR